MKISIEKGKKKKGRYSKFIILMIIAGLAVFTWRVLEVFGATGAEPSVLVGAVFAFGTGELWALAGIRKEKAKHEQTGFDTENY